MSKRTHGNYPRGLFYLISLLLEFQAGAAHLLEETVSGVHTGIGGSGGQTAGIHVTLPVGTDDDAALTVHHTTGQNGVGTLGIDLRQQQGRSPAEDGVAGGVGEVPA